MKFWNSSIRARLALLLAGLAALTAAAVGVLSLGVTSNRFSQEIDTSLSRVANLIQNADGRYATNACAKSEFGPPLSPVRDADLADATGVLRGRGHHGGPDDQALGLDNPPDISAKQNPALNVGQCISSAGAVTQSWGSVALPVNAVDRQIARSTSVRKFRTENIDGENYRLLTVSAPKVGAIQIGRPTAENDRVLGALIRRIAFLVAAASVGAGLTGLLVASQFAKPIVSLTKAAEKIAGTGELDVTIPSSVRSDETGRLSHAFASMVGALQVSKAQQQQLIYDASHELRTPLTSLKANITLLKRHPGLVESKRLDIVNDLQSEMNELTDLVNELVALAADSSVEEQLGDFDVASSVEEAVQRWVRRTGRQISADIETKGLVVNGRKKSFMRAVNNLLSNAVKFSPDGSPVAVKVFEQIEPEPIKAEPSRSGPIKSGPIRTGLGQRSPKLASHYLTVQVDDNGKGFSEGDVNHVFDRFFRSELHRSLPGSGLGLAIVAKTAQEGRGFTQAGNNASGGARVSFSIKIESDPDNALR